MTYALSGPLQAAVYARLSGDAALDALVGDHVYDALPAGPLPALYVALGPERVRDASDGSDGGALHDFIVSVVTGSAGFQGAKQAAAAISDALCGAEMTLSRGQVVGLWFLKAKAARETGGLRRIDLTFRARVEDSAAA
ncbi:DUF3168 domain-containing protein [Pseudoponticoccus marisrubri]|uniref:Gene transfer agent protein n=1 Tax=Pseudoponticoccus marisrubri TaxID=1685382 RepID=A0A0W7WMW8_9RHOB|nr:DUF3168 domain-containing protein [Pseudoponticoccus marisrubri]KUF11936.1 hypothetical protein AVJ23_04990 [Pseudoponticoccus marisrubri]